MLSQAHSIVLTHSNGRVLSGPFLGMSIDPQAVSWGDGDIVTKLLGCYEQELQGVLEHAIARRIPRFVNVGCAEGYYAVGVARHGIPVVAVDTSEAALAASRHNAMLNGVELILHRDVPRPVRGDFWLVDIEGGEADLLRDSDGWQGVELLVELHEWVDRSLADRLLRIFGSSHDGQLLTMGARNPNRFDFLSGLPDAARFSLMSENRPERMRWLHLRPC